MSREAIRRTTGAWLLQRLKCKRGQSAMVTCRECSLHRPGFLYLSTTSVFSRPRYYETSAVTGESVMDAFARLLDNAAAPHVGLPPA